MQSVKYVREIIATFFESASGYTHYAQFGNFKGGTERETLLVGAG